jgi:parallel beta-helix repeat protein
MTMKNFYVAPNGHDRWSGTRPVPNASRTDGPWATPAGAQRALRKLKGRKGFSEPINVYLRGGTYRMSEPLVFTPRDSGTPSRRIHDPKNPWAATEPAPVTYAAYKNEKPVLSGGRRITGWKMTTVNGRNAWVAYIPDVKRGRWYFRELWVNDRRADRPVGPRKGFFRVEKPMGKAKTEWAWSGGHKEFIAEPGTMRPWTNLTDVEVVVYNYWIDSHMRIKKFDPATRHVWLDRFAQTHLHDEWGKNGAQYRIEGALELMTRPGEWCMDSRRGRVYYLPRPGERIATAQIVAPVLQALVRFEGQDAVKEANRKPVELLNFQGLAFSHSEWTPPADFAGSTQAAHDVPGAIVLNHSRLINFERCSVTHVGSYGIECATGCFDVKIVGNDIADLGGGGVKVWHENTRTTITDNEIAHGGRIHGQAIGVLVGQSSGTLILHNHIHDFHYSGISVGWRWGYAEGKAYGNVIEYNHVHDLGHGLLSDMGGIYTLGPQPGTRIRYNLFHDVTSRTYGGWGIYTDEGSSDILIENNIAYNTKCGGFHQHYGKDNIVRNNIFAWSTENQLARSRLEPHNSFTFERNIILIREGLFWKGNWSGSNAVLRGNLYWDTRWARRRPSPARMFLAGEGKDKIDVVKWRRKMKLDQDSLIADPQFVNPAKGDFRLKSGSPAAKIGFIPFDLTGVGVRRERR